MASSKGSKGLGKGLGALLGDISVSPSGEEQVTSTSWPGRPMRASRTQPPTTQASWPAASSASTTRMA